MRGALRRLLWPESVAILGATPTSKWVHRILSSTRALGYKGQVFPVTPDHETLDGLKCYPSLGAVPHLPDAAVVVTGREAAVGAVEEAADRGVGGVVVLTGGFAEAGPDGSALQERLCEVARRTGMALIGPNCQGYINCLHPSALWTADISDPLPPGSVAIISPSGGVSSGIMNHLYLRGVHTSYTLSTGNEAVLTAADLIDAFVEDRATRVIVAHLETLRDPPRFFAACDRAAEADKPVVMLKVGRTPAASEAIQAHTGALAGPDRIIDAQCRRHRIVRVSSLDELVETCIALCGRRLTSPRISAFASSGAHIGLVVDAAASTALRFPSFSAETTAKLTEGEPGEHRTPSNPLDTGFALRGALDTIAEDPQIDTALFITQTRRRPNGVMDILTAFLEMAERLHDTSNKPVVVLSANNDVEPSVSVRLAARGIPVLAGVEMGLRALENVCRYTRPRPAQAQPVVIDGAALQRRLHDLRRPVAGQEALDLLAGLGVSTVKSVEAESVEAAVAAAQSLGYPVVVKTGAPDVLHKSETGQVFLNMMSADAVGKAARAITPPILVQPYVAGGTELIIGLQSDPEMGTCIAVGMGGVLAELLDTAVLRAVPLRVGEAAEMLTELPMHKVLEGYRGRPAADRGAVVATIERIAAVGAVAGPMIRSLDLNPVVASPAGVCVIDALLIPRRLSVRPDPGRE